MILIKTLDEIKMILQGSMIGVEILIYITYNTGNL